MSFLFRAVQRNHLRCGCRRYRGQEWQVWSLLSDYMAKLLFVPDARIKNYVAGRIVIDAIAQRRLSVTVAPNGPWLPVAFADLSYTASATLLPAPAVHDVTSLPNPLAVVAQSLSVSVTPEVVGMLYAVTIAVFAVTGVTAGADADVAAGSCSPNTTATSRGVDWSTQ